LLHIGSRVNVAVISGFLQKLMSLPIAFFDTKLTGDILQRIEDNNRIEEFLTSASLNILFSFFNLVVFGIVLAIFSIKILALFLTGSLLYIVWVSLFMKSRATLDHQRFKQMSVSGNKLINMVNGMQEIKLTQSELSMRWDWEKLQAALFGLKIKGLSIIQYQSAGATFINEVTNVLITIVAATAVLKGNMTLGMMLAVQFIIGQLNVPVSQIISFFRMSQDAKMSLDRLAEVHNLEEEEPDPEVKVRKLPDKKDIYYIPDAIVNHYIPDSRVQISFIKKLGIGIGISEMLRLRNRGTFFVISGIIKEGLKWIASIILMIYYCFIIKFEKGIMIMKFRSYVTKGVFLDLIS